MTDRERAENRLRSLAPIPRTKSAQMLKDQARYVALKKKPNLNAKGVRLIEMAVKSYREDAEQVARDGTYPLALFVGSHD